MFAFSRGLTVAAACALIASACGGGASSPGDLVGPTSTVAGVTTVPMTTAPAEPADIAATISPDPGALLLDDSGALVPGDQVLVILAEGQGRETAEVAASAAGGELVGQVDLASMWQIRIPPTDLVGLEAAVAAAAGVEGVELAFPNGSVTTDEEIWGTPISPLDDPVYAGPAGDGYRMIGVEQAWRYVRGSGLPLGPVHVGVTDSGVWTGTGEFDSDRVTVREVTPGVGINAAPEDLTARQADGTWAVVGSEPSGGHGTGVTSLIGADPDNGGTVGILAPVADATITVTNVFNPPYGTGSLRAVPLDIADDAQILYPNGVAYTHGVFQAIAEQIRDGATVINMSWGCTGCNQRTATAFRLFFERMAARHPEVLFVASAGNDGQAVNGSTRYPSGLHLPNMITVGNVMNDGSNAASTNTASATYEVTMAAPGEQAVQGIDVNGVVIDDTYAYPGGLRMSGGTSMAAPQVTAAAALLKSIDRSLTAAQIKELLVTSARTTIVRPDGTEQTIDAGVGGRVLAVDEAVRHAIARKLGVAITDPRVSPEQLANLGSMRAVARSGEGDEWTVTGYVDACHPGCTDLTIELQGQGAIGGSTSKNVAAAPGEATWGLTLTAYPTTVVVRRTDNRAGSRILIDRAAEPELSGRWVGVFVIDYAEDLDGDVDLSSEIGVSAQVEADMALDSTGTVYRGGVTATSSRWVELPGNTSDMGILEFTVDGDQVSMYLALPFPWEMTDCVGTISESDGSITMSGTWARRPGQKVVFSGHWELTHTG